jgi:hypothetical protein
VADAEVATPGAGSDHACPSARAAPGNLLYGQVKDGRVARLGTPMAVDQAFVDALAANGPPEQRFRFAGRCVESGCAQWLEAAGGGRCGVIDRVLAETDAKATGLPRCFLRADCRWFAQAGAAACAACDLVVTDSRARAPSGSGPSTPTR